MVKSTKFISLCGPLRSFQVADYISLYLNIPCINGVGYDDRQLHLEAVISSYTDEKDYEEAALLSLVKDTIHLRQTVGISLVKNPKGVMMPANFIDTIASYSVLTPHLSVKEMIDISKNISLFKMVPHKIIYMYNKPDVPSIFNTKLDKQYLTIFKILEMLPVRSKVFKYEVDVLKESSEAAVDILKLIGEYNEED